MSKCSCRNAAKATLTRRIAQGEQRRQNTDYAEIEARILVKLKKLPSYDLNWVECMINHLIARTQQPPEPAKIPTRPQTPEPRLTPHGQYSAFHGEIKNPMPIGDSEKVE